MISQLDVTLLSYSSGFVSGFCFSYATAFSSVDRMADLCEMYWDYSLNQARGLAAQAALNLTGAIFLLTSFALQVAAALWNPASNPISLPNRASSFLTFFLFALVIFGAVAFYLQHSLYQWRWPKLLAELQRRHPPDK